MSQRIYLFFEKHKVLSSIYDFMVCFLLYNVAFPIPLHEFLHLSVLRWCGGDGVIQIFPGAVVTIPTKNPTTPHGILLSAFSGGLGVGLIYFLMLSREDEIEERLAILPQMFAQTSYGMFEGLYFLTGIKFFLEYMPHALYIPFILVAGYTVYQLLQHWSKM